ncbi:MAG: MipA/OmpV family protein [Pseudomonadota bacterium]
MRASFLSTAIVAGILTVGLGSVSTLASDRSFGLKVGGGVFFGPKYQGSSEYRILPVPLIMPHFSGEPGEFRRRVTVRGLDDIRFDLLDNERFELGPVVGYTFGRDEDDADILDGLGDVDGGLLLGGYVAYDLDWFKIDAVATTQVTGGESGYQITLGAQNDYVVSDTITLTARVGTTFADDTYMSTNFGITAAQSLASTAGLAAFDAGAGVKDVHLELGANIALTENWDLNLRARYGRLLGDAADSPVVESEDQLSGGLRLTYKFNW